MHAFLVDTIHSAPGPVAVSSVLGVLIDVSACAMVGDRWYFFVQILATIVVGLGRTHRLAIWKARRRAGLTAREVEDCDRGYLLWAASFALLLGLTCHQLAYMPRRRAPSRSRSR